MTDSTPKLKPLQLAALVILMAEARELTNNEFKDMARFTLTGKDRAELERPGLVESRKVGQLLAFQLTDKGWAFCKQLHTANVNVDRSVAARSVFVLLDGLGRSLDRLRVSHADFFKQPAEVASAVPVVVSGGGDADGAKHLSGFHAEFLRGGAQGVVERVVRELCLGQNFTRFF